MPTFPLERAVPTTVNKPKFNKNRRAWLGGFYFKPWIYTAAGVSPSAGASGAGAIGSSSGIGIGSTGASVPGAGVIGFISSDIVLFI